MNANGTALYTRELLALAVQLADYPLDDGLPLRGEASSRSCGSKLALACELDGADLIGRVGMRASACAVGQAAAAIFAAEACGRNAQDIERALDEIERWLHGEGARPAWPGITVLEAALPHTARHGAILLPWRAARDALCKADAHG